MADAQIDQWKRLSIEAVVIVVSILFAFAIDAWWDERNERQYEQDALLGLESEYEDHRSTVDRQIAQHKDLMGAVAHLMLACQSGTYATPDMSLDDAIYYMMVPVTTDLGSGARDSLISAGRIEVLSNPELRYALVEWDRVLDEVTDGQVLSRNLVRESIIPLLAEMGISIAYGADGKDRHPWPISTRPISTFGDKQEQIFANEEFCTMLEHRYSHMNHTLEEFEELLNAVVDLLDLIRGSQAETVS